MIGTPPAQAPPRPSWARILAAGIVVAIVDAVFAMALQVAYTNELAPARIFRGIASGLMGPDAFAAGFAPVLLGVALHTAFACAWAMIYGASYRLSPALRRLVQGAFAAIVAAFLFGALVWIVMNYVAKPVGGIDVTSASTRYFWVMLVGHGAFVGLPTVLLIRRRALDTGRLFE